MKWPPYAADITLELYQHRQTNQHYVKVSYIGQDQKIPGCSDVYCLLQEFKEALAVYALPDEHYFALCDSIDDHPKL